MNLRALIQANLKNPHRKFQALTNRTNDEATIYLYDVIDPFFGVSAQAFVQELSKIDAKTIHLRINSPGGDVFEGRAIATAVRQHPSNIVSHVDGWAASAASYVALAGDEVEIADGARFMIHKAWTIAFGNSDDLMETAELLEGIDADLVREYAATTGSDEKQIEQWMRDEKWFTADEAVEHGFADRKVAAFEGGKKAMAAWDLSAYANAPTAPLEPPEAPGAPEDDRILIFERAQRIAATL